MFLLGFQEMILPNILTTNYWHLWSLFKGRMLRNGQKMRKISWLTWTRKRGWGRGCDIVKSNMHFLNHIQFYFENLWGTYSRTRSGLNLEGLLSLPRVLIEGTMPIDLPPRAILPYLPNRWLNLLTESPWKSHRPSSPCPPTPIGQHTGLKMTKASLILNFQRFPMPVAMQNLDLCLSTKAIRCLRSSWSKSHIPAEILQWIPGTEIAEFVRWLYRRNLRLKVNVLQRKLNF